MMTKAKKSIIELTKEINIGIDYANGNKVWGGIHKLIALKREQILDDIEKIINEENIAKLIMDGTIESMTCKDIAEVLKVRLITKLREQRS